MTQSQFDEFAKRLGHTTSRRAFLRTAAGGLGAAFMGSIGARRDDVLAKPNKKNKKRKGVQRSVPLCHAIGQTPVVICDLDRATGVETCSEPTRNPSLAGPLCDNMTRSAGYQSLHAHLVSGGFGRADVTAVVITRETTGTSTTVHGASYERHADGALADLYLAIAADGSESVLAFLLDADGEIDEILAASSDGQIDVLPLSQEGTNAVATRVEPTRSLAAKSTTATNGSAQRVNVSGALDVLCMNEGPYEATLCTQLCGMVFKIIGCGKGPQGRLARLIFNGRIVGLALTCGPYAPACVVAILGMIHVACGTAGKVVCGPACAAICPEPEPDPEPCGGACSDCEICTNNVCVAVTCPACQVCANGVCVAVTCPACQVCANDICVALCGHCQLCTVDGTCVPDPDCEPDCETDADCGECQTCFGGLCGTDPACNQCSPTAADCGDCQVCNLGEDGIYRCIPDAGCDLCTTDADCGVEETCSVCENGICSGSNDYGCIERHVCTYYVRTVCSPPDEYTPIEPECGVYQFTEGVCECHVTTEGQKACLPSLTNAGWVRQFHQCDNVQYCASTLECPDGWYCVVAPCCSGNICVSPEEMNWCYVEHHAQPGA